jgi:hypothetical protein
LPLAIREFTLEGKLKSSHPASLFRTVGTTFWEHQIMAEICQPANPSLFPMAMYSAVCLATVVL